MFSFVELQEAKELQQTATDELNSCPAQRAIGSVEPGPGSLYRRDNSNLCIPQHDFGASVLRKSKVYEISSQSSDPKIFEAGAGSRDGVEHAGRP